MEREARILRVTGLQTQANSKRCTGVPARDRAKPLQPEGFRLRVLVRVELVDLGGGILVEGRG